MNNQLTTISTLSNQSLETILENGAYKSQSTKDKIRLWMPIALRALNLGATNKKCQYSLNDLMQQNNLTLFAEFNYGSLNGKMRTVYNIVHDMLIDLINGNKQGSNELNMLATWTISLINDLRKNVVGWQDLIPSPGLNSLEKMELYFSLIEGKHLPSYL